MKSWILPVVFAALTVAAAPLRGADAGRTIAGDSKIAAAKTLTATDTIAVDVYLQFNNALWHALWPAKARVSEIFARIGVNLNWHTGPRPADREDVQNDTIRPSFSIRWVERAPMTVPAGALASAHPFYSSEASITLYADRLQQFLEHHSDAQDVGFAYVLAHELAHVMQGLERHSDSGILKAHWSDRDCYQMRSHKLAFMATDVDLIHLGLEARMSDRQTRQTTARVPPQNNVVSLVHQ